MPIALKTGGKRPNVLIILTDEQRHDHVGFGGNPVVRTPHLDALAARSRVFRNAYVANPTCMPNRATIFTGRMPSAHGVRTNGVTLDKEANTFSKMMRAEGYRTAYFGKCHLQALGELKEWRDATYAGSPAADARPMWYGEDWETLEDHARHRRERVKMPPNFYGFDEVELTTGHGDRCSGHYYHWLKDKGIDPKAIQGSKVALPYEPPPLPIPLIWRTRCPDELYPTAYVTERTIEFLKSTKDSSQPFLAVASYPDPHAPFTPPGRYFDMYDPASMPLPENFYNPHASSMPLFRVMAQHRGARPIDRIAHIVNEEQYREMVAKEYGMITMIDDGVGAILAALEDTGHADDTIVIFTSDHGDMFGDHGLILKGLMHYEACIKVPLTIHVPGMRGGETRSLASSLDLARTILDLTECPEYFGIQGKSLTPIIDKPEAEIHDSLLIEEEQQVAHPDTGRPVNMRTLVTREARLTLYAGSPLGELFELKRDPLELNNLFAEESAKALRTALTERLAYAMMEHSTAAAKPTFVA